MTRSVLDTRKIAGRGSRTGVSCPGLITARSLYYPNIAALCA